MAESITTGNINNIKGFIRLAKRKIWLRFFVNRFALCYRLFAGLLLLSGFLHLYFAKLTVLYGLMMSSIPFVIGMSLLITKMPSTSDCVNLIDHQCDNKSRLTTSLELIRNNKIHELTYAPLVLHQTAQVLPQLTQNLKLTEFGVTKPIAWLPSFIAIVGMAFLIQPNDSDPTSPLALAYRANNKADEPQVVTPPSLYDEIKKSSGEIANTIEASDSETSDALDGESSSDTFDKSNRDMLTKEFGDTSSSPQNRRALHSISTDPEQTGTPLNSLSTNGIGKQAANDLEQTTPQTMQEMDIKLANIPILGESVSGPGESSIALDNSDISYPVSSEESKPNFRVNESPAPYTNRFSPRQQLYVGVYMNQIHGQP